MAAGSRTDGGNQVTSFRVRKIIQSIKEIVGKHSDADIYAVLKESNMDPNETAQKLLNQDPFHEVKRKRDKKKELTGYRGLSDNRRHVEHNVQPGRHVEHHVQPARHVEHHVHPARHVEHHVQPGRCVEHNVHPARHVEHLVQPPRSHTMWDRNGRRGGYIRNSVPGSKTLSRVSREFRIVRDNRVKHNVNKDAESVQHPASGTDQAKTTFPEKSVGGTPVIPQSVNKPCDTAHDGPGNKEDVVQGGTLRPSLLEKTSPMARVTSSQAQREVKDNSKAHSASTYANSVIGVYSSSSDPVHVPSPASRSAGTVGAIRREVGVVGVRKQSSNHPVSNSSLSNSSFSVPSLGKDVSSSPESFGQSVATSKSSQLDQAAASEPTVAPTRTTCSQYNSKVHQQPIGHQKAMQSMEWKPKSSQKPAIISPSTSRQASAPFSSHADNSSDSNLVDVTNLSEKLSEVNILEERHVIIPQHLQVPESERTQLTFGSFGTGFDSTKGSSSVSQAFESAERSNDGPSLSLSTSVPMGSSGNTSAEDQGDLSDCQASRSNSPASATVSEQTPPENNESLDHQNIENYGDIGLVQGQSPSYTTSHSHHLQTPTSLPSFSEYDPQKSYDHLPFLRTVMEDNSRAQGFVSSSEAVSSHATNSSPPPTITLAQQQQPLQQQQQQQQQQPLANMYPQVHISHFPNFMPYRHIFSPVYVPPMAMPNYSSNQAYPHPSNASSYLLMPGGSSHVTAGGMKYAASQYKPVPAGSPTAYGNYANPTGFTISPPGSVGGTGLEDGTRIKYKDNNLYVPNLQAEASDIWIQPPRELSSLQSAPYYNLAGQPPHAAAPAFIPAAHAGHTPFNAAAAQPSHVQYPGLYHPPASPAPIAGPHHLVHQSGLGGNIGGVGVAAAPPGSQVGAYQQPQLSHLNWPANF